MKLSRILSLVLLTLFITIIGCDKVFEIDAPGGVFLSYETVLNSKQLEKYNWRLLTDTERNELIKKGWLDNQKTTGCSWGDDPINVLPCDGMGYYCDKVYLIQGADPLEPMIGIGCFDQNGNLLSVGLFRPF